MKNKANRIMALAIAATLMIPCVSTVSAANKRDIGDLSGITCYYKKWSESEKAKKIRNNGDAAVNLVPDYGYAWIKCEMIDKNERRQGGVCLQRGTRATFSVTGKKGTYYKLRLKRLYSTGDGKSTIVKGTWCPDSK